MESSPPSRSWSIYTRSEIIHKYEILERIGSGTYSDVYRARRISDSTIVALKEVHDCQSAIQEIEALQVLQNSPNVVILHEYFWRENEDVVLVLEYLRTDLAAVIRDSKRNRDGGMFVGEIKRWIFQILHGVDACHRNLIMHRDLKPSNLLISDDGVLKLADFGQARILSETGFLVEKDTSPLQPCSSEGNNLFQQDIANQAETHEVNPQDTVDEINNETNVPDDNSSCLATYCTSDFEDETIQSTYSNDGALTSCVGTRWYRAPELLYGSTNYGTEIDLWSLGCIFAELFSLEPIFPGASDIDQLSRIISVLGNLTPDSWTGCLNLPDYKTISFTNVVKPTGLEACLDKHGADEISFVKKLICYDPGSRATAMELLHDKFLYEEPLPVSIHELRIPLNCEDDSLGGWDVDSETDMDEFAPVSITPTKSGFSIQFP